MSSPSSPSFRRVTASPGSIRLADGATIPCVVRNLSMGGAKLECDADATLSETMHLTIEEFGIDAESEVIWRIGAQMGVRFLVKLRAVKVAPAHRPDPEPAQNPIGIAEISVGPRHRGTVG